MSCLSVYGCPLAKKRKALEKQPLEPPAKRRPFLTSCPGEEEEEDSCAYASYENEAMELGSIGKEQGEVVEEEEEEEGERDGDEEEDGEVEDEFSEDNDEQGEEEEEEEDEVEVERADTAVGGEECLDEEEEVDDGDDEEEQDDDGEEDEQEEDEEEEQNHQQGELADFHFGCVDEKDSSEPRNQGCRQWESTSL